MFVESQIREIYGPLTYSLSISTFRKIGLMTSYVVCQFGSFESILHYCGRPRHPYIVSTDTMMRDAKLRVLMKKDHHYYKEQNHVDLRVMKGLCREAVVKFSVNGNSERE